MPFEGETKKQEARNVSGNYQPAVIISCAYNTVANTRYHVVNVQNTLGLGRLGINMFLRG